MMGRLAFDALRDLRFKSMIIRLDGDLAGEFATRLTIDGVGARQDRHAADHPQPAQPSIPLKFNVTIKGPFRALIATAKSFRDPRQRDRATCCRVRSTKCPGSSPRSAAARKSRPRPRPRSTNEVDVNPNPHQQARDEP